MSERLVDRLARALLYEGYVLYPYRPSVKNQRRWTFGVIYPPGGEEPSTMRTECLITGGGNATLHVAVRFLHLVERTGAGEPWQEAVERNIDLGEIAVSRLLEATLTRTISFPPRHEESDGVVRDQEGIEGSVDVRATELGDGLAQISVTIQNQTPLGSGDPLRLSLVSTHTILRVDGGGFVSLTDPPARWQRQAAACHNLGAWPVLVGEDGQTDTLLSSPIILPDYPEVAPQSPGDLFDATEIDEILTLRILTLTDEEKRAAAATDDRVRQLLDRTESLARDQLMGLHGTMRGLRPVAPRPRVGDRVRIRPRKRADAMDIALSGRMALVVSIERDFENNTHFAVTIDDDPGKDLGQTGMPGHRFFFSPDEVELVRS
jgi:hypothetical protein